MSGESVSLTQDEAMAAFVGLLAAFQHAVVYTAFRERLEVNGKGGSARLDALSKKLIRATEGLPIECIQDSDDSKGTELATCAVRQIIADIRGGL